ncbi:MAG: hypothetical protein ACE5R6_03840 [Candidatus Heimdallarchaeota archaeon]
MKELRYILVTATILNLVLLFGWIGLTSEGTLTKSSDMTISPGLESSLQAQLRFASGGALETPMVKKNELYPTAVIFAENWNFDQFPPVPGNLIPGAKISFEGDTSKATRFYKDRGNGIYDIEITPKQSGSLYFKIKASKDGYALSSVELILSVEQTPSELLFVSNNLSIETGVVEINSTYTTFIKFTSDSSLINDANIGVVSQFSGYNFSWTSTPDPGVYNVTISPTEVGKEVYSIWAAVEGVATSSVDLILTSTPFQTALRFISNKISRETNQGRERVNINETYTTLVQFNRTSTTPETPIDGASLRVTPSDPGVFHHPVVPLGNGIYNISIWANQSKQFSIVIEAGKPWYSNASATLTLEVSLIPANLEVINPDFQENQLNVTFTDPINVTIRFQDDQGPLAWDNYTIDGGGLHFHSLATGEEFGVYIFHFNASHPETYYVALNATATGHEAAVLNIKISADPIPMAYELYKNGERQGSVINIDEGRSTKITLILRESHVPSHPRDNELIGGAHVEYSWEGGSGVMQDLGNGTYTLELSGEGLDTGTPHQFNISATKGHDFKALKITYSVVINPKPPSQFERWLSDYWYIAMGGIIAGFGLLGYMFRRRQQSKKEQALFEERIRSCYELISDILSFQDLLIISADGSLIYGFRTATAVEASGGGESLHSAFMMALKTFAGESIMLDELIGEDHFRFGETEIFLVSGDMATFAFLYEAQMIDDEWKRVSTEMLARCKEVVAAIEFEFQEALEGYQESHDSALISQKKITRRISEIMELDVRMAHELKLTGKKLQIEEAYLPNKKAILESIQQLDMETGAIILTTLLERVADLGIPTDEAVFIFYQLRVGGMLQPKLNENPINIT